MINLTKIGLFECLNERNNNDSLKGNEIVITEKNNTYVIDRVVRAEFEFSNGFKMVDSYIGDFTYDLETCVEMKFKLFNPVLYNNYVKTFNAIDTLTLEVLVVDCMDVQKMYIVEVEFKDLMISNITGGFTTDSCTRIVLKSKYDDN